MYELLYTLPNLACHDARISQNTATLLRDPKAYSQLSIYRWWMTSGSLEPRSPGEGRMHHGLNRPGASQPFLTFSMLKPIQVLAVGSFEPTT